MPGKRYKKDLVCYYVAFLSILCFHTSAFNLLRLGQTICVTLHCSSAQGIRIFWPRC